MLLCVSPDGGADATPGVDMSPGGGGGDATPIVGMSPAKAETDRAQVRINAIPSRFMGFSYLRITRNLASRDTRNLASANKQ